MNEAILDSDILSEVMKQKDPNVSSAAQRYLNRYGRFSFSAMTVYEIVRGLRDVGTTRQLRSFLARVAASDVLPISDDVLMRASELWVEARQKGRPRNDADLIIAATALEADRILVTGNTSHFDWVSSLKLENWRQP